MTFSRSAISCLLPFFGIFVQFSLLAQEVDNLEDWSSKPVSVTTDDSDQPPSDAIILFAGEGLDEWQHADKSAAKWNVTDGILEIVPGTGNLRTKQAFGDVQLHVEWMIPTSDYGTGNSGIYLQGRYEVQIFNSYQDEEKIYYNGQTGSIYKQSKPLINASKPKGQWEVFDIIFRAPRFSNDGTLESPAVLTVFHNGLLIQDHFELVGITTHQPKTAYKPHDSKQPLMIQDHGDKVRFRNIWIREL